jgi:pSer/pThr/pTyr-binding forkhead associated (FHA) protein
MPSPSAMGPTSERRGAAALVCVVARNRPSRMVLPLMDGRVVLGRRLPESFPDPRVSRLHVEVWQEDGGWGFRDLGSRNGTYVDGEKIQTAHSNRPVLRIGDSILLCVTGRDESDGLPLRREEIPWLIRGMVPRTLSISASFYYRALLAPWPGQMRELTRFIVKVLSSVGQSSILTETTFTASYG